MGASPDAMSQILQGLLGDQSQSPQGGLMGALNGALAPYGGSNQVALQLLANKSGGSSLGSVLGQSLLASQQQGMDNQAKKLQMAQQAAQLAPLLYRANALRMAQSGQGGPGTTLGGIQPQQSSPFGQQQPQIAPQGQQGPPGAPQQSAGPTAQSPNIPVPDERKAAPSPTDFDVPSVDIGSIPVNGNSPEQANFYEQALGDKVTPTKAAENVRTAQLQVAQSAIGPKLNALDSVIGSQSPTQVVSSDPALMQVWKSTAPLIGANPADPNSFTDGNVRQALGLQRNKLAAWAQLPRADVPIQDQQVKGPLGSVYQVDSKNNKMTQVKGEEGLKAVIGPDGQPVYVTDSEAVGKKPFNQSIFGANSISDDAVQLAADTYRTTGKMPAAFGRNPAMQAKVLDRVASDAKAVGDTAGAIQARSSALKANGMALDQITKLQAATNSYSATLDKNLTNLEQSYSKIDSSGSPLINKAVRIWQQKGTGDPQTADMIVWLNAAQGEYAKLKSGNLGNAAPSNAAMDDAKEVINKYMNQGGIKAVAAAMRQEATNRKQALLEQQQELQGSVGSNAPSTAPAKAGQSTTVGGFTVTRVK